MSLLKKGDKIAFISPSCDKTRKELSSAVKYFKSMGLNPIISDYVGKHKPHNVEYDKIRAEHINSAFADSEIKALVCVRGGANSNCILPYLDYDLIKKNPKLIIGLSDSTGIQNALFTLCKNPSLTGYLPAYKLEDNNVLSYTGSALQNALFEDSNRINSGKCIVAGKTKGKIVGGNLAVFTYLCGTKYFPNLKGKILLLEEVDEKTYKINQQLQQLRQQKDFSKLNGIIIGQFTTVPTPDKEDKTLAETIQNFTKDLNIPIIGDFNYGHIPNREIIPLGKDVELYSDTKGCWLDW